jgi:hypothetical protein
MIETNEQTSTLREGFEKAWAVIEAILPDSKPLRLLRDHTRVIVHITVAHMPSGYGALTEYAIADNLNQKQDCGLSLTQAFLRVPQPTKVIARVQLRTSQYEYKGGYIEILQILIHELAVHCLPLIEYSDKILGKDQQTVSSWGSLVQNGDLSGQRQHTEMANGNNLFYPDIIGDASRYLKSNGKAADAVKLIECYHNDVNHLRGTSGLETISFNPIAASMI